MQCIVIGPVCVFVAGGVRTLLQPARAQCLRLSERFLHMKSNEYNMTNNYNDKVKMILRSRLGANIKHVVTTLYSVIKMGFFDKTDNVSCSNIIKKVLH